MICVTEDHLKIITDHARVCYNKLYKPTHWTLEDLIQEGHIILTKSVGRCTNVDTFIAYLRRGLQNRFGAIVHYSYKTHRIANEIEGESANIFVQIGSSVSYVDCISDLVDKLTRPEAEFLGMLLAPPKGITITAEQFGICMPKFKKKVKKLLLVNA